MTELVVEPGGAALFLVAEHETPAPSPGPPC
jgi:hypothetical protein